MPDKPSRRSKRMWLNAIVISIAAGTALLNTDLVKNNPAATLWIIAIVAVANAVLTLISTDKITLL